jgi:5-methylcytosine-specific restriction endonuclease McrA
VPGDSCAPSPPQKLAPIAKGSYGLQTSLTQEDHDLLLYIQSLMGTTDLHKIQSRALKALARELEKEKLGAGSQPRRNRSANPRHIPLAIKCAVWKRDGAQCSFVRGGGRRCSAKIGIEFDHIIPVAKGGVATLDNIRLLCRAHNQHAADCAFGAGFMKAKREAVRAAKEQEPKTKAQLAAEEVIPWLGSLGIKGDLARFAAAACEAIPDAPLEKRIKLALKTYGQRRFVGMIPAS